MSLFDRPLGRMAPGLRLDAAVRVKSLADDVKHLLEAQAHKLPFHGWPHTDFVRRKAVEFAAARGADVVLVEATALVHDLNYLEEPNSPPRRGRELRRKLLEACDFYADEIKRIEEIIEGAHTEYRGREVDLETACLSDADTLYKTLPITPVLYAHRYLAENGLELEELAKKIVDEQVHKHDDDYYFYDPELAEEYGHWVDVNLGLWKAIHKAMADPLIASLAREQ